MGVVLVSRAFLGMWHGEDLSAVVLRCTPAWDFRRVVDSDVCARFLVGESFHSPDSHLLVFLYLWALWMPAALLLAACAAWRRWR